MGQTLVTEGLMPPTVNRLSHKEDGRFMQLCRNIQYAGLRHMVAIAVVESPNADNCNRVALLFRWLRFLRSKATVQHQLQKLVS